jgi:hypothetical protein
MVPRVNQNNVTIEFCSTPVIINGGGFNKNQRQPIMLSSQKAMECIDSLILELTFRINVKLI